MIDKEHINKKSGYYQGPSGVFYDARHDEIFTLQADGVELYNVPKKQFEGRFYDMTTPDGLKKHVVVTGLDKTTFLGEL
jgi:hypothetical protein